MVCDSFIAVIGKRQRKTEFVSELVKQIDLCIACISGHQHLCCDCLVQRNQTGALPSGRYEIAVFLIGHCGVHHQAADIGCKIRAGQIDAELFEILTENSGAACNIRRGHGSTGGCTISAVISRRTHTAADAHDVGAQIQRRFDTP